MVFYAHTLDGVGEEGWEPLENHLSEVAELAAEFAGAFGAADWGRVLGQWHDLGKYSAAFQAYLRGTGGTDAGEADGDVSEVGSAGGSGRVPGRVDHSTYGAQAIARAVRGQPGQVLAFCIAGHHAGLADATAVDALSQGATLAARLANTRIPEVSLPADIPAPPQLTLPFKLAQNAPGQPTAGFSVAFFTRMLFSCLVDADRICTEAFCDKPQADLRRGHKPSLADLKAALDTHLQEKAAAAPPTPVNALRQTVLADCLHAAGLQPGFFSLNVPTGGGKTLSSLAFALSHAQRHGLRRVVMAIPFTSIIEQTADVYRRAFASLGDRAELALVEHHTSINSNTNSRRHQLATENWDVPLIVTTNVQLFESLFAAATTPCRKLHRLAGSVIILDEAQTLPVEMLAPTLEALKELVAHYGCTVVLCTATQPALEHHPDNFPIGIPAPTPIIRDESALFAALRRTRVTHLGKLPDAELVSRLAGHSSVLCIVNTRPHAVKLYEELVEKAGPNGTYHLSTFMCAQHRRDVLAGIRKRLAEMKPTRIISTQLIEAGVDIDLPVVYRAAAGFDSIAQAAGRCNREGKLDGLGEVFTFDAEQLPPPGLLRAAAARAAELLPQHPDPLAPSAIQAYFDLFYWHLGHRRWDKDEILKAFEITPRPELPFKFRYAAAHYKLIADDQAPVLVPYNEEAARIIRDLQAGRFDFTLLRTAQKYTVSLRERDLRKLADNTAIVLDQSSGLWLLSNPDGYSQKTGLLANVAGFDPAGLIY